MALRGLAASGPSSRGPLDEAVAAAEERGAPAVLATGGAPEDDEEDEGRGRGLLRWDGFSAWLHCVCVVGFDLELGQAVEECQWSGGQRCLDLSCGERKLQERGVSRYWGQSTMFLFSLQSLVLISKLPYIHFFHTVLKQIAPEYFEKNEPYLEAACNDVDRWPAPVPGKTLHLPIMGVVMKVRIPTCHDKPGTTQIAQLTQQADTHISVILPTVHEVDLFRCFCPVFLHSQMLWELVLLGEPLVVMAPSPSESSETVLALVNCISPLKYFSDFRPYFTIHDSEFKEYTTRTQAPPSVILGVTNPFFAKTLQHWPHIIRIGDLKPAGEIPKQVKVKKLKNLKTLDSKPGVYTSYKPYLNRDEEIIKQLQKGVQQKRPSEAQSVILRRYFLELTQSFIIPLERYVASLMPLQKSISPWKSPPQLRQFLPEEFMKTLEKTGPQLTSRIKGDWIGLYRHFLKSPNFDGWFKTRRKEMTQKLEALHLEVLCEEDLLLWTQKHTEVETVDLVLKLKNKLLQADREHLPVKPDTMEKLRTHIDAIILALPEDLQGILLKTGMT
ncbi:protein DENND6A [Herpailurus yagouaroundi]|uniref:protein DENND6A n=1 Tax=Herpailurus yagouaroundi TaxID=1608482 RepID=UPI001AD6104A|nr:protein DENND6A [Puma yagouaroundi]